MIHCPPEPTLERFLAGALPAGDTTAIGAHLETCAACRGWLTDAQADEGLLEDLRHVPSPPGLAPLPERIADYRILREIGGGGMGVVYEAEQDNPRRRVALKVVRPGLVTARTLRRFEIEAQVLGRLQHPGIAQILQAGTFGSGAGVQPFFAMELIRGRPLLDAVGELGVPQILTLFERICAAVQHAHEKGVIHRDLKPSNILVDESGQPMILDFGVARLQDDAEPLERDRREDHGDARKRHTYAGQLVGTLAYMSPEQVGGDPTAVDIRSDVYALGVVLYELLTGRLPHDLASTTTAEAVDRIANSERAPLSAHDRRLGGELETIVHKAIARSPQSRYESAAELAAELRRFRNHEPITALPASAGYQLRKFARRNRALVAAVAGVFVVLVAGIVSTVILWQRAEDAAVRARREAAEAESTREFIQEILIQASPEHNHGRVPTVRDAFDTALRRVDRLEDEPWVEAAVRHTLGRVQTDLGDHAKAKEQLTRSLALYEEIYGREHKKVAYVLTSLSRLYFESGDFASSEAAARRAVGMRELFAGKHRIVLGSTLLAAARAAYMSGRMASAEDLTRDAIAMFTQVGGDRSINVAISEAILATVVGARGRSGEAERLYRRSLRRQREILGDRSPRIATSLANFASALVEQGKLEEAERLCREVLSIRREHDGDEHPSVGLALRALGGVLCRRKAHAEGLALMRKGLKMQEAGLGPHHGRVAQSQLLLGEALRSAGRLEEALAAGRLAVERASKAFPPHHLLTLRARLSVAAILSEQKNVAAARPLAVATRDLLREHWPSSKRWIQEAERLVERLTKEAGKDDAK